MLETAGYPARLLDVRADDFGGPYDAVLADAVLADAVLLHHKGGVVAIVRL